jgi:phosphatidylserine decarboxylase
LNSYPHPILAREGWPFIGIAAGLSLMLTPVLGAWSLPLWLLTVFVVQFFRDPARVIAGGGKSVVAPADGRIVAVEKTTDPYLNREALKVSVFMNVFNVHSNRSPVDGTVKTVTYSAGTFLNASLDKASTGNERNALHLLTDAGADVTCVQVAGLIARRILCYVKAGDHLARGQRYGFIRFGSRVDLYLPPDAVPSAAVGEKVRASSTLLAELA